MRAPPHLVVTDSGFGGFSLCARLEAHLARTNTRAAITYVNACPADALGYNDMATLARKTATFANVLAAIERRFDPDAIVVACNTLSALFDAGTALPARRTHAVLDVGGRLLADDLAAHPEARAWVLATATTAAARPFDARLRARGVAPARLRYRACPGLQNVISSDLDGAATAAALAPIAAALAGEPVAAVLLGCTHYSLDPAAFARAFPASRVLDPVAALADALAADLAGPPGALEVRFVSRYRPPDRELVAVARRLAVAAPRCAAAVAGVSVDADLFPVAPA